MMKSFHFKKLLKKYYWLIILALLAIFILGYALRLLLPNFEKQITLSSEPEKELIAKEALNSELLFNNEIGTDLFSKRIVAELDEAKHSIEIAMYAFTLTSVRDAVYRASERGVKVTIITDAKKDEMHDIFFIKVPESIKRLSPSNSSTLMHHKFVLIDRGEKTAKLIFGAYNFTDLQEKYDPSFLFISDNEDLIASFGGEFDRLEASLSGLSKYEDRNYSPWDLNLKAGEYNYEVWFSPGKRGESVKGRLLELVQSASSSLKIMIWDFTDKDLAVEIIKKAREGVKVQIITDTWNFNNQYSVFHYLLEAKERYALDNFELITDHKNGDLILETAGADVNPDFDPFLHHHLLIVDDNTALFGTNNWSQAGSFSNDESIMVTNDKKIVSDFLGSFNYHYQVNR